MSLYNHWIISLPTNAWIRQLLFLKVNIMIFRLLACIGIIWCTHILNILPNFIAFVSWCKSSLIVLIIITTLRIGFPWFIYFYPVHCTKLTPIQPTWCAYPYLLVFLIRYLYSSVSFYGNAVQTFERKGHCSWYGVPMGCHSAATVTSQLYGLYCLTVYTRNWAGARWS